MRYGATACEGARGGAWHRGIACCLALVCGAAMAAPAERRPVLTAEDVAQTLLDLEAGRPPEDDVEHLALATEVVAAARTLGDRSAQARGELAATRHLRLAGLWDEVERRSRVALALAQAAGEVDTVLVAKLALAASLMFRDRGAEAQELLLAVLAEADEERMPAPRARAYLSLSSVAARGGFHDLALDHADRTIAIAEEHGFQELTVRALVNRVRILLDRGEVERARAEYERVLAVDLDAPSRSLQQLLAMVGMAVAPPALAEKAVRSLELAERAEAGGWFYQQAHALANAARALCAAGKVDEAVQHFERAREIYGSSDVQRERSEVLSGMADCLAGAGRHEAAHAAAKEALQYALRAADRQRTEQMASLNVAYESEQRLKQLAEAEAARSELEVIAVRQQRDRAWLIAFAAVAGVLALLALLRARARSAQARLAEAGQQARIHLLAQTGHEIRNPAQGLTSALSAALAREGDPEQRRLLETARQAASVIARLASDAFDLSLIEAGRLRLRPVPTDLGRLLDDAVGLLGAETRAKGLDLRLCWEIAQGTVARIDAERVTQVLLNLIANAIRYTPAGAVEVHSALLADGRWEVCVADTGPGLSADDLQQVFEPYYRGDSSARSDGGGLGLAVAWRIAQAHGGDLSAANRPEGGAEFCLRLLVEQVELDRPPPEPAPPGRLDGMRVLIVDDNEFSRLGARFLAERVGAEVADTAGGAEMDTLVQAFRPDVVLCDRHLGAQNGAALLAGLRPPGSAGSRRILMSGDAACRDEAAGLEGFLLKPFDGAALVAACLSTVPPDAWPAEPG